MKTPRYLIQAILLGLFVLLSRTAGAQPVTKVAVAGFNSLFLKSDGSLWGMGNNQEGQLGNGNYSATNRPVEILTGNVTAIAEGADAFSLFLKNDNTAWGMGLNGFGQLGIGSLNSSEQILATNVAAISAGGDHSLFLKSDGSLLAIGNNVVGQLGDSTYNNTNSLQQVVPSNVKAIAAGQDHSLFLKTNGSLWGMGDNANGALGDGSYNMTNMPEQIVGSNVTAIAAGGFHSLFLKSDGSLWAMGSNGNGQLGDGSTENNSYETNRPEQIVSSNVTAIAAGYSHSLFIKSDGSLWAMGNNSNGQLGNGTYIQTNRPERIVASNVTAIAAGYEHSLFVKSDGSLWAMGDNSYGQLGDGTTTGTNSPEMVLPPPGYNQISEQLLSNGGMQLSFVGIAATSYALDRSVSLSPANWIPQATNPAGSLGVLLFTNTPDTTTNNFWRIRSVP